MTELQQTDSLGEIFELIKRRNAAAAKRIAKAARKNGATAEQLEAISSLLSACPPERSVRAPVATNQDLCNYATARTGSALTQILGGRGVRVIYAKYQLAVINRDISHGVVLKALKAVIEPQIKRDHQHFMAVMMPQVVDNALVMVAHSVSWSAASHNAENATRRRRSAAAIDSADHFEVVDSQSAHVAAAHMWGLTALPELAHDTKRDVETCTPEFDAFVLRSGMMLNRVGFGYGQGRTLWRSIRLEVNARAESYDLVGIAPLQAQGIPAFVSKLPCDLNGTLCTPPVIKLL